MTARWRPFRHRHHSDKVKPEIFYYRVFIRTHRDYSQINQDAVFRLFRASPRWISNRSKKPVSTLFNQTV
ncbi:hypothetical protein KCP71_12965 [Salmonella enterica subsp. enterica]|nr:hypothetical protein KCP71_12965 [Salmonella enterica subsp. enterica]